MSMFPRSVRCKRLGFLPWNAGHYTFNRFQGRALSDAASPLKKVIFSGMQPTGVAHLGNYLGALRQWVDIQNQASEDTTLLYSLVDLHAITIKQDPAQLREWKKQSVAMLLAIGIDPTRSTIFHQSEASAHPELMWILSCQTSTGLLSRMTQWKDKTQSEKANSEKLKLGLYSYPVLQAADILVHGTTHVPVGEDQAQHLEFTRELATSFNHHYQTSVFQIPETIISPAKRIRSLTDPTSKMSKSHANQKSRILLTDSQEAIQAKFKAAMTDSLEGIEYDVEKRPGVSNLLEIIYYARSMEDDRDHSGKKALAADMKDMSLRALKERAAEVTEELIAPIREKYFEIVSDENHLNNITKQGAGTARRNAVPKVQAVKKAMGLM